jgi:sulfoxide reductase heme-binding subunit YedZ
LSPFAYLFWAAFANQLGANPAETLIRSTGDWVLRALCLVLLLTPLSNWIQVPALVSLRRMLGLFVYFYVTLHLISYALFDMGLDLVAIVADVIKRPFITVGMLAFVLLTALAVTSPHAVVRKMGGKRWKQLHRAVYVIAALGVLHFFWMRSGKQNFAEVWLYGLILGVLLVVRIPIVARYTRRAAS